MTATGSRSFPASAVVTPGDRVLPRRRRRARVRERRSGRTWCPSSRPRGRAPRTRRPAQSRATAREFTPPASGSTTARARIGSTGLDDQYYRFDADFSYRLYAYPLEEIRVGYTRLLGDTEARIRDVQCAAPCTGDGGLQGRRLVRARARVDRRRAARWPRDRDGDAGRLRGRRPPRRRGSARSTAATSRSASSTSTRRHDRVLPARLGDGARLPMAATVEVTNLPASNRDTGVRLYYDIAPDVGDGPAARPPRRLRGAQPDEVARLHRWRQRHGGVLGTTMRTFAIVVLLDLGPRIAVGRARRARRRRHGHLRRSRRARTASAPAASSSCSTRSSRRIRAPARCCAITSRSVRSRSSRAAIAIAVAHADDDAREARARRRSACGSSRRKKHFVDPWAEQVDASKGPRRPSSQRRPVAEPAIDHAGARRAGVAGHARPGAGAADRALGPAARRRIPTRRTARRSRARSRACARRSPQRDAALGREGQQRAQRRSPPADRGARRGARTRGQRGPLLVARRVERAVPGHVDRPRVPRRAAGRVDHAWLFVRPRGAAGFTRSELVPDGDAYLRAHDRCARSSAGDAVEWYVEVRARARRRAGARLSSRAAEGDRDRGRPSPSRRPAGSLARRRCTSTTSTSTAGSNKGFDQYYQAEVDFTYRFIDPIYAVRLGFGTLSGTGGPKDVIDADPTDTASTTQGAYRCRTSRSRTCTPRSSCGCGPTCALMLRPQVGLLTTDTMPDSDGSRCSGPRRRRLRVRHRLRRARAAAARRASSARTS